MARYEHLPIFRAAFDRLDAPRGHGPGANGGAGLAVTAGNARPPAAGRLRTDGLDCRDRAAGRADRRAAPDPILGRTGDRSDG